MKIAFLLLVISLLFVLTSCQLYQPPAEIEPTVTSTLSAPVILDTVQSEGTVVEVTRVVEVFIEQETASPPVQEDKELTVCLSSEPKTFYPHADNLTESDLAVQHAVFENDFTNLSYDFQPVGLVKIPSFADQDLFFQSVEVTEGEEVVDGVTGLPRPLEIGMTVKNEAGELVTFDGAPINMRQMVAFFQLKERTWSDGRPVTASDSLFSYEMAAHPDTPADKFRIARTASYEAVDDLSIRWIGMPGFEDRQVVLNFAKPLPQHIMGTLSAAELVNAEISARRPIGDGPFKILAWEPGERIVMTKNENYYRKAEGLPHVDRLTFLFFGQSGTLISQLLSGECDIVTHDGLDFRDAPFLLDAEVREQLTTYFETGTVYEHIDFGINSAPGYGDSIGRPDWFEDARVRQGITHCTDRQRMNEEIFFGLSEIMHSYFPESHPLFDPSAAQWAYDPDSGNRLLDEAGFRDDDEDGIREAFDGTPFRVTMGTTTGNIMRQQIGQIFAENMRDCGILIDLTYLPSEEWFASGPEGPLFGRKFDLAEFGWRVDERFSCNLFTSEQVPGVSESWDGLNVTGWREAEFDTACQAAQESFPGMAEYENNHKIAQQIFAENMPIMPLFLRVKVAATSPDVLNFDLDPTQASELYNVYEIDLTR